jgi:AcrR family transcriptional regulator
VILRVAAELFARDGYRATSMQSIAEELGIAKPTLYVHGRSKEALLEGIMDAFVERSEKVLARALAVTDEADWMRELLKGWLEHSLAMAPHLDAYLTERREVSREADERYRRWSKSVDDRITANVARQQPQGVLRDGIDTTIVTYTLIALTNWTVRWYTPDGRLSLDEVIDGYWGILWRGLAPCPPETRVRQALGGEHQ